MQTKLVPLLLAGFAARASQNAAAGGGSPPEAEQPPLVHTYSIVARDSQTGELGVADWS
ncbi:MAG: hypothetical protein ACYS7M_09215 [Planctomycetota bacterium]|jgi:hypothetical protein